MACAGGATRRMKGKYLSGCGWGGRETRACARGGGRGAGVSEGGGHGAREGVGVRVWWGLGVGGCGVSRGLHGLPPVRVCRSVGRAQLRHAHAPPHTLRRNPCNARKTDTSGESDTPTPPTHRRRRQQSRATSFTSRPPEPAATTPFALRLSPRFRCVL